MNINYFASVLFTILAPIAFAQNIILPDSVFYNKLLESSDQNFTAKDLDGNYFAVDSNFDGVIQLSEAAEVSFIDVHSSLISSLTGIEQFSNLVVLLADGNTLTQSNLVMPTMLNLKEFRCGNCSLLSLDVTSLPALELLNAETNTLAAINLQNNPNLQSFRGSHNLLTSIDIHGLENLNFLDIDYNFIEFLNANGCISLELLYASSNHISNLGLLNCVNLDTVNLDFNNLTDLSLPYSPQLNSIELDFNHLVNLDISLSNQLRVLSVTHNNLTNIDLSANPLIQNLYISDNELEGIDLSMQTQLYYLNCDQNPLQYVQLGNNPMLEVMECNYTAVQTLDLSSSLLLKQINCSHNPQLSQLYLKKTSIEQIVSFIDCPNLEYICCDSDQIASLSELAQEYPDCVVDANCSLHTFEPEEPLSTVMTYPNPANEILYISSKSPVKRITFYDLSGRLVAEKINVQNFIGVSELRTGTYFTQIETADGLYFKKILIFKK